jgi:hypothetical protein
MTVGLERKVLVLVLLLVLPSISRGAPAANTFLDFLLFERVQLLLTFSSRRSVSTFALPARRSVPYAASVHG